MKQKNILWLDDITEAESDIIDQSLYQLSQVRHLANVPNGFILTSQVFEEFLASSQLANRIDQLILDLTVASADHKLQLVEHIQRLITQTKVPNALALEIFSAYKHLTPAKKNTSVLHKVQHIFSDNQPLVTVSCYDSTVCLSQSNLQGESNLIEAIKSGWAKVFNAKTHSLPKPVIFIHPALIEKATIFTSLNKDLSKHVLATINVLWTNGHNSDSYEINLQDKLVVFESHASPHGRTEKLSISRLLDLALLTQKLDQHFYFPQRYKFSLSGDELYLTSLKPHNFVVPDKIAESPTSPQEPIVHYQRPQIQWLEIAHGTPQGKGVSKGYAKILHSSRSFISVHRGDIVVLKSMTQEFIPILKKAGGLVTESTWNKSISSRNLPIISEVKNATTLFRNNQVLILQASEGKISIHS